METLQELQRKLSAALALDEEGRTRRAKAAERKRVALATFANDGPAVRAQHEQAARANAIARAQHEQASSAAQAAWFALQGASDHRDRDWGVKLARYQATGMKEVVRFDPEDEEQPVRIWDRIDSPF